MYGDKTLGTHNGVLIYGGRPVVTATAPDEAKTGGGMQGDAIQLGKETFS